jgi:hypothetical protein
VDAYLADLAAAVSTVAEKGQVAVAQAATY